MNWLRARATKDRATEELALVRKEMEWVPAYFTHRKEMWKKYVETANSPGHRCYASYQVDLWGRLSNNAVNSFSQFQQIQ